MYSINNSNQSATAKRLFGRGLLVFCLCGILSAQAQTPPDAGTLRQQIEQELRPPALPPAAPERPAFPAEMKPADGVVVTVNAFRFAGNTLLTSEQLAPVVAPWLARPLGLDALREAAAAVAQTYRDTGWIVRAYLPKQDITSGEVTIQIIEAVFGGARLEGAEPTRLKLPDVLSFVEAQQAPGKPLNAAALDRALLLADDLPGVAVSGSLRPGKHAGETELVLKMTDEPLLTGTLSADNQGSRSTGEDRDSLALTLSSPLQFGDRLRLNYLASAGSEYSQLDYSIPVGHDGGRLGINGSQLRYHLVTPEFTALNGHGTSDSLGANLSYPLIRTRLRNLYATLAYESKGFHNEASGTVQSDYTIDRWTLAIYGNLFDKFGGGGVNSASLSWTQGRLDFGTLDLTENPARSGEFDKFNLALSRQQVLTDTLSLYIAWSGQTANRELDSSERFTLGGPSGVRAYPVSEGSGSEGQLANIEIRWRLPQSIVLTGFYDWGKVENPDPTSSYALKGYGLSLAWTAPYGIDLRAVWARRDGANPNPGSTGKDQDGSYDKNRLWLTVSLNF